MVAHRFVAVVGARVLPEAWASQVAAVVRFFLERGWGIGSGGAQGADQYALHAAPHGSAPVTPPGRAPARTLGRRRLGCPAPRGG